VSLETTYTPLDAEKYFALKQNFNFDDSTLFFDIFMILFRYLTGLRFCRKNYSP